jgi:hypothetical protein
MKLTALITVFAAAVIAGYRIEARRHPQEDPCRVCRRDDLRLP